MQGQHMRRCVLYLRVSTDEQATDGYSIQMQKERLIAYCKAKGWVIVRIFIDAGWSGASLERPAMEDLMEYVQDDRCDMVLVYKLDRLSRSQKDTLYLIEELFLPNKVDFVSVQESFDTSTPFGLAMVGILSVFAQLERETIKERTMSGRIGRAKEGLWHGGGTHPIGYDYIDGKLQVNKAEAEQVRMVYNLYASGYTPTAIREKMEGYKTKHGDWRHIETITTVLDNELYTGTVHFEDARAPESHTAIIEPSLYDKVKYMRDRNRRAGNGNKKSTHLLTGLLHCSECGARYFSKKAPNGNYFYTCHSRAKVNPRMVKNRGCKNKNWPKNDLEQLVIDKVLSLAKNPGKVNEIIKHEKAAVEDGGLKRKNPHAEEIEKIDKEISKNMELYQSDHLSVDFISEQINELYSRKMLLISEHVENEEKRVVRDFHVEGVKLLLNEIDTAWKDSGMEYRQKVLSDLIDRIDLDQGNVKICWSFA